MRRLKSDVLPPCLFFRGAERSAPGYGPERAVDGDESTLWVASLRPAPENNHVWFQLDLGNVVPSLSQIEGAIKNVE